MTKRYIANINAGHWDGENDCEMFKTIKGQEVVTDDPRIQARCVLQGFEEITENESYMRTEHDRTNGMTTEQLKVTQLKEVKPRKRRSKKG